MINLGDFDGVFEWEDSIFTDDYYDNLEELEEDYYDSLELEDETDDDYEDDVDETFYNPYMGCDDYEFERDSEWY